MLQYRKQLKRKEEGSSDSKTCIQQSNMRLLHSAAPLSSPKLDVEQEVQEMIKDGMALGFGELNISKEMAAYIQGQVSREIENWADTQ